MYTKVHTEGIIVRSFDVGESDRMFGIFTRDLGLVYARGRGVRAHTSRQRASLQSLSHIDVSLVRAASGWRITNVSARTSLFSRCGDDATKLGFVTRILGLLKRLVTGEEGNETLYATVAASFEYLFANVVSPDDLRAFEALTVLRILHALGYLKQEDAWEWALADVASVQPEMLVAMRRLRSRAIAEINKALHESQL